LLDALNTLRLATGILITDVTRRGEGVGLTRKGKGTKIQVIAERALSWFVYHRNLPVRRERHGALFAEFVLLGRLMLTLHRLAS
jgi:hypothetical protein